MTDSIKGMYDVALKPKLLRSLLREYVPDDKHPFSNPSELSYVVSTVKAHKLLSEWSPHTVEQDLIDGWKAVVDSWINRLLTLVSSNLPDKCWAGICLLGVTSQECSTERFLASYSVWLNKLLPLIQPPVVSQFVMAASCASLSDIFTRISELSNAKKDGTSQATRIIQPVLKLFSEDISAVALEEAICLLCTMTTLFPLSVHRHYDSVEAAIVSKLMSGKCSASVSKKLGYVLSLLPRSRGDEDSWSLMMDKILLSINNQLNDAFQGLEEESKGMETMRALLPSGKQPPPPLGGLEQSLDLSWRPERLLGSRISTLMHGCCNMLTSSYPVLVNSHSELFSGFRKNWACLLLLVPVPIRGLVALARRVLMVDGSLSLSSYAFMTTLKQDFICSELPLLQLHSLEILMAVVKGLSSQLLPHVADIVRLLTEYLRRCAFSDLRIKAYSIMKVLLISMGIGIAIHLNQDVINNILIDLDFLDGEKDKNLGTYSKVPAELLSESRQRKRKHSSIMGPVQEQLTCDVQEALHNLTPITVKIAALEALETLLTVGGSMRSESWRAKVDYLLINMATDACREGWSSEERKVFLSGEPTPVWANYQLATLRALLASLISPGRVRPSHLGLGLELFRRGMQETGTKLAEFCGHALLSLEVLIHPRARSLLELQPDTVYTNENRQVYTFHSGKPGKDLGEPESDDDELKESWLGNNTESEIQVSDGQQNVNFIEKPPKDPFPVKLPSVQGNSFTHVPVQGNSFTHIPVQGDSFTHVPEASEVRASSSYITNKGVSDGDDLMVESHSIAVDHLVGDQPGTGALDIAVKSAVISEVYEPESPSSKHELQTKDDEEFTAILERMSATLRNTVRSKGLFESDNESSDGFPDIVDGDPDSD
ncbi:hypothetical protein ACJIZ3_022788 [Penstemon smallii]|uniref:Pre-rRNA-processing protein RIX1 N-terminal domain-containing protein n=1 Tax=Penstemon smallii TaxID=265156 RepID=A0ABD3TN56_9LAMI